MRVAVQSRRRSARTGARVVTASDDRTARLWDAATGRGDRPCCAGMRVAVSAPPSRPDGRAGG